MTDTVDEVIPPPSDWVVDVLEPAFSTLQETGEEIEVPLPIHDGKSPSEVIDDLGRWYFRTEAELAAVEARNSALIERLQGDIDHLKNRRDFLKRYLGKCLPSAPNAEYASDDVRLFWKETESVIVTDVDQIPDPYCTAEVVVKVDKNELKAAIARGEDVTGAHVERKLHIQVKPGGVRAKDNARARQKKLREA